MANLLEAYKNRLSIAEGIYSREHGGRKMESYKKLNVARMLENTSKFLNLK